MAMWSYTMYWYWNQEAIVYSIDEINNDPTILPNTTILVKRFRNNRKPAVSSDFAYNMALANEISSSYPEILGMFGGMFPVEVALSGQIYGQNQIPVCTGSMLYPILDSRSNFPYYFQTMTTLETYAQAIMLALKSWNVKRVSIINEGPLDEASWGGVVARVLQKHGFLIHLQNFSSYNKSNICSGCGKRTSSVRLTIHDSMRQLKDYSGDIF
ncbi:periplasmic binding protein-like I [Obelidium mucronatum]|nr:periplasmic binding protein-like I [Obelidium mucronatum]